MSNHGLETVQTASPCGCTEYLAGLRQDGSSETCIWGWEETGSSDLRAALVDHPEIQVCSFKSTRQKVAINQAKVDKASTLIVDLSNISQLLILDLS